MNQRPFISTQLNIFDDNRCVFSSGSIGRQPVMISQEQNRKICDSTTTAIASNQSRINPSYCAGPPPTMCSNQQQIWACPVQAQRQGIPGGVAFNFPQPNYVCPPTCFPSAYNPPPPPTPQLMDIQYKTPQSICVDYGRYGMEAMAFQQKCRQQCRGFTYDKHVGTNDQTIFPKSDACCCGVQSGGLNAEQKEQLFHRIDESGSKAKLKDMASETDSKKRCICFPKPDPNKFGSAKTLVIGERKEKTCKDYDIVEKATNEADAEAYLCCDCLDKWKKENEKNRPSCLKKRTEPTTQNQNESRDISISLSGNALEIREEKQIKPKSASKEMKQVESLNISHGTENKQRESNKQPATQYDIQKIALKDATSEMKRNSKTENIQRSDKHQKMMGSIRNLRKNLIELRVDFHKNIKDMVSYLDRDIQVYTKYFEEMKANENDSKEKSEQGLNALKPSTNTNPEAKNSESIEKGNQEKQEQNLNETKLSTTTKPEAKITVSNGEENKENTERELNESTPSTTTNPEAKISGLNIIKSQTDEQNPGLNNEFQGRSDLSDQNIKVEDSSKSNEQENGKNVNYEVTKIEQEVKIATEKVANDQSSVAPATHKQKSDIKNDSNDNSDDTKAPEDVYGSEEQNLENIKGSSFLRTEELFKEDRTKKKTAQEVRINEKESENNKSNTEAFEATTSYQDKLDPVIGNKVSSASIDGEKEHQIGSDKQDQENQTGNPSTSDTQNSKDTTGSEKSKEPSHDLDDKKLPENNEKEKMLSEVSRSGERKTCECDVEDDKSGEQKNNLDFISCTCRSSDPLSKFGGIISNFCASTVERAGNILNYITNRRSCAPTGQPFYENPRIITNSYGCHTDCYHRRIKRYFSDLDRPICSSRMSTNRFCGRTCYDHDRNMWYSCCHGFRDDENLVEITFRETSERRIIRLENNCRNTRYHVVYE